MIEFIKKEIENNNLMIDSLIEENDKLFYIGKNIAYNNILNIINSKKQQNEKSYK